MKIYSLALLVALVGCGDSSSSSSEPVPTPEQESEDSANLDGDVTPVSFLADIYLRGGMNGWEALPESMFAFEDGCYTLDQDIPAGQYEFKVASEDWIYVNIGGYVVEGLSTADEVRNTLSVDSELVVNARLVREDITPDQVKALPDPKNLILDLAEDQSLNFKVCFPENDLETISLTVSSN